MKQNLEPLIPQPPVKTPVPTPQIIIGIIIGVVLTSVSVYAAFLAGKNSISYRPIPTPTPYVAPTAAVYPTATPVPNSPLTPGNITWLQFPKVISAAFYKDDPDYGFLAKDVKYQQVGTFADGSVLIDAVVPPWGMGTSFIERFIKTPDGQVYYLTSLNDHNFTKILDSSARFSDIKIDGLQTPDILSTGKGDLRIAPIPFNRILSFTELKNPRLITDTAYGRVYATYEPRKDIPLISRRTLWLRLRDDTVVSYEVKAGFFSDDNVPKITWADNTQNTDKYNIGFYGGCGAQGGQVVTPGTNLSYEVIGHAVSGTQEIKVISDTGNPVLKGIYASLSDPTAYDEFIKRHNYFFWQDGLGDRMLFINESNMSGAECAKPVIYLYPQTDTQVNVRVGASITVSDPRYPDAGWTVFAHPDGRLDYQGRIYPNLFWEGKGLGIYNSHYGEGVVVTQKNLIPTLKSQLKQLGLNAQESADFLDYWTPKLPADRYVRLTWLTTPDMDELAPLAVSPKPDTSIRIFLDFAGLKKPLALTPQKLTSLPRQGFTLIEWGGLLRK